MLEESVDPQTTAFLYRVAARLRGAAVIPDAVDAAGRHGVAIGLDNATGPTGLDAPPGVRMEWIFDRSTYAFLGQRVVELHDSSVGEAGAVVYVSAVLGRAVVDHAPDTSRGTSG